MKDREALARFTQGKKTGLRGGQTQQPLTTIESAFNHG